MKKLFSTFIAIIVYGVVTIAVYMGTTAFYNYLNVKTALLATQQFTEGSNAYQNLRQLYILENIAGYIWPCYFVISTVLIAIFVAFQIYSIRKR